MAAADGITVLARNGDVRSLCCGDGGVLSSDDEFLFRHFCIDLEVVKICLIGENLVVKNPLR